jgi:thiol-disulfide isomerase/thioredoxin
MHRCGRGWSRFPVRPRFALRVSVVALVVLGMNLAAAADSGRVKKRDSRIVFTTDLDQGLELARATGLPVYLAFGAAWCPVCRRMEEVTLLEPRMQALADEFVWVKVDIDRSNSLAREWGVEASPTIFLLDSEGRSRRKIVGGASAEDLSARLRRFLDELDSEPPAVDADDTEVFQNTPVTLKPDGFRGKSICFSHVGYGPLNLRSQSPFQSLRLGIVPRTPSTLARGQHQVRVGGTWSNIWSNDRGSFDPENGDYGPYLLDYETFDATLAYAYGLSDTFQIEVEYEQRWRFGGGMDSLIEAFHDLFSLGQAGRTEWPRDETHIFVHPENGSPPVSLSGSDAGGVFARDLLMTFQHNVTCGTARWPAISWAVTGRYSLGNPGDLEGSAFDLGLSAAASRRFGRFYAYLTLGYVWYGSDGVYGLELETTQFTVLAAAEWRFKPRMSLTLQYLGTQGVAKDLGVFSETSNEVVLGWKWEIGQAGVLEIGLLENIVVFDNSPDLGFHVGFTRRF